MTFDSSMLTFVIAQDGAAAPGLAGGIQDNSQQGTTTSTGQPVDPNSQQATGTGGGGGGFMNIIILMLPLFLLFLIITSSRAQKKEQKRKEEMLSTVAKHDKVVLGSGIIGTVAEVRSDEVVLKIDNNTGARLTVQKAAVSSILKKHGQASNQEEQEQEQGFGGEELEAELETADRR